VSKVRPKPNRLTADNADFADAEKNSRARLPLSAPSAKSAVKSSGPEIEHKPLALPRGWVEVTIGDLVDRLQYGHTAKAIHSGDGPRFLRITDITDEGVDWGRVPGCQIGGSELEKYRLAEGDIVFARSGSIEKAWRVKSPPDAIFASYLIRGRPLNPQIGEWLSKFIRTRSYLVQIGAASSGTGMQNVNAKKLSSVRLLLPPSAEQSRIIDRLEALEARSRRARALLAEVPAQLAQARQSLLAAAFRGDLTADWRRSSGANESGSALLDRLRTERRKNWETAELHKMRARGKEPTDYTWKARYVEPGASQCADPLPATWTWACLLELEEGDRKSGYGVLKPGPHEPTGIRMLKSGQVRHGWVDLSEDYRISPGLDAEFAKTRLRGGEVLINLVGASIGRSAVAPPETAGCNLSRAIGMIPVPRQIAVYVQLVLGSPVCQRLIIEKTGGSAQGVLNMEEVRSLAIPLPPETEQHEIVRRLTAALARLDAAARAHAAAVAELDRLDQSLLARAFSGTLVPQVAP
jgi:type I restriction enzyme, S subunit